jgi:diguanylate cyclase (GGDEF)-like protein
MLKRIHTVMQRHIDRAGLATRIVLAFILVFALTGTGGVYLMQLSLLPTFQNIEQKSVQDTATRLLSGFDEQLVSLGDLNRDWAYWDEMHAHLTRHNRSFENSNVGEAPMSTSKLHAVLLLSKTNGLAGFGARSLSNGYTPRPQELLSLLQGRFQALNDHQPRTRCSLAWFADLPAALCWTGVVRSDGSGPASGTVIMLREIDAKDLQNISKNAGAEFELVSADNQSIPPAHAGVTLPVPAFEFLGASALHIDYQSTTLNVQSDLLAVDGMPAARLLVNTPREWMVTANALLNDMMLQWALVALVSGVVLIAVIQRWLVRPVARLRNDLVALTETKRWDSVLAYDRPDEIGELTQGINALLVVLHEQVRRLEKISRTDPLTGIANRRKLDERLAMELSRMGRHRAPLSLLLIDVDHFKKYNDHYGHPEGDIALKKVATLLVACSRQQDLAARFGGEEFAMLLPNTNEAGARAVAEKIMGEMQTLGIAHAHSPTSSWLTVSVGGSTWHEVHAGGADALITEADKALYVAKRAGRMRASFYRE